MLLPIRLLTRFALVTSLEERLQSLPRLQPSPPFHGIGFLETQLKIQVHFLMLIGTAFIFTVGAALYIYDFFRTRPRFTLIEDAEAARSDGNARARVSPAT